MRYWKRVNIEGKTTTVESYSHDLDIEGAIEIAEAEFNAYIASLPELVEPRRNVLVEIDELKAIVADHEARLKQDVGGHIR